MKVTVITATVDPVGVISRAAGTCYGKDDESLRRLENCYKTGHMSVFEHASATFKVEGISRACSHQLVRHRLASFCQESQRYCKVDVDNDDWFVAPPMLHHTSGFSDAMRSAAKSYLDAIDYGIKPEDARYMLPEATKTNIMVTMNCRELFHFLEMRQSKAAQWEIRALAKSMEAELANIPWWDKILDLRY